MEYTYKQILDVSGAVNTSMVVRSDGACIPCDPANTDYAKIMQLVAEGKLTIAPAGA
jgi:hypothetical protein